MFARILLGTAFPLILAAALAGPAAAQKIYIVTDLEGASGVYHFGQTREKGSPANLKACEFLMGDIAAVVRGLRAGGAQEILILDGHGNQAFVPELMVSGAKYITGQPRPEVYCGLDDSFAGMVMLGLHAMKGTPDGVLNHTQSSMSENRYWYNGVESGELAQSAIYAAHFGVPPIMVTGDEAACREARKFFGEACVTAAVKQGLSREAAVLYPFEETRRELFEAAKRAMAAIPRCKPYRVEFPLAAKKEYLDPNDNSAQRKTITKEGTIPDALHLYDF
jgi:D-amino peptidase